MQGLTPMGNNHRVVIVGAGLAGLTAASVLVASEVVEPGQILILEANEEVGGRLATETLDGATFDHGAQFFTVRTERFQQRVDAWLADGTVAVWCRGFGEPDGYPRYAGVGGMGSIAVALATELTAAGVAIRCAAPTSLGAGRPEAASGGTGGGGTGGGWSIAWPAGPMPSRAGGTTADAVLVTPPVPVALELVAPIVDQVDQAALAQLRALSCHRVLAVLVALDGDPGLPHPGARQQPDDPTFSFVADNAAKGISDRRCMTFHTAHSLSAELWSLDDDAVLEQLRPEIEQYTGSASITNVALRRWPQSGPVQALPEPFSTLAESPGPMLVAGDGFGGSKVEGAFTSGAAAADALIEYFSQ